MRYRQPDFQYRAGILNSPESLRTTVPWFWLGTTMKEEARWRPLITGRSEVNVAISSIVLGSVRKWRIVWEARSSSTVKTNIRLVRGWPPMNSRQPYPKIDPRALAHFQRYIHRMNRCIWSLPRRNPSTPLFTSRKEKWKWKWKSIIKTHQNESISIPPFSKRKKHPKLQTPSPFLNKPR